MGSDTPTGNAAPAERSIRAVKHVEDEHQFCPMCGMCVDCDDCAIWGCGRTAPYSETDE